MPTRIEFVEAEKSIPGMNLRFEPKIVGFCAESPKEVLERLFSKWRIATYRRRDFLTGSGIAIYSHNAEQDSEDRKSKIHERCQKMGIEIISPSVLTFEQFFEQIERTSQWEYISSTDRTYDLYRVSKDKGHWFSVPELQKEGYLEPTWENLARLEILSWMDSAGKKNIGWRDHRRITKNRKQLASLLYEDIPTREACEVMTKRDNLTKRDFLKYLRENVPWPKVGTYFHDY